MEEFRYLRFKLDGLHPLDMKGDVKFSGNQIMSRVISSYAKISSCQSSFTGKFKDVHTCTHLFDISTNP